MSNIMKDAKIEAMHAQYARLEEENRRLLGLLSSAATGLHDIRLGVEERHLVAPSGLVGDGLLLRELVVALRGRGVDDEKGWDCDVTEDIPVVGETLKQRLEALSTPAAPGH
jgi:hypothetical protein